MAISPKKNLAVDVANTDGVYSNIRYNATLHKALDFSNVGIPNGTINGADAGNAKFLRQFHQTRIFIQSMGVVLPCIITPNAETIIQHI